MRELQLELSQKEAFKTGSRIAVDPKPETEQGDELKAGDTVKVEGKECVVMHVQPVSSGYIHTFRREVNGKSITTSQTVNGKKLILTLEAKSNASGAKEKPADKAAAKA